VLVGGVGGDEAGCVEDLGVDEKVFG